MMNRCPSCGGVLFIKFESQKEDEQEMEHNSGFNNQLAKRIRRSEGIKPTKTPKRFHLPKTPGEELRELLASEAAQIKIPKVTKEDFIK